MIDPNTVRRIMDAAQIYDVVSEFVTLRKRGANYWGVCPFHNEKTPSFSVSPSKGIFKCFGCGKGGNAANFLMEHENISYPEALRVLAKKYHIEIEEREQTDEEKQAQNERESMLAANEFAAKYFEDTLKNHADGQTLGLTYLRERGFSDEIIREFRLGYATGAWSALSDAAKVKGYNLDFFERNGLCKRGEKGGLYDFFRERIIFPWLSIGGQVVAFTGRVLSRETKGVSQKYLNSPESDIYHKDQEIFGIYQAKQAITKADCVYMVEGQTDVLSMHQCGVKNVVACSGGKGLSETQAHKLHRFTTNIVLMYDTDEAGEKDTNQAIGVALAEGLNVSVVRLPEGEDPDSYARAHNANDFVDYIERNKTDFATYKCLQIAASTQKNPTRKAQLINDELLPALALIYNEILLAEYIKICATQLDLREDTIRSAIRKLRRQKIEKEQARLANAAENAENALPEPPPQYAQAVEITAEDDKFLQLEKDILKFALLYGNEPIFADEERVWTANEFIVNELLESDQITFKRPLHQAFLYEIAAHHHDAGFDPIHFFGQHFDPNISQLAAELLSDKYTLSKMYNDDGNAPKVEGRTERERASAQERLDRYRQKRHQEKMQAICEDLSKVIVEYKNTLILSNIKQTMLDLKNASQNGDTAAIEQAMAKIDQLNTQKNQAAKMLGGRVVAKIG